VLRTVVFTVATLLLVALARWSRDALLSLESDLVQRLMVFTPAVSRIVAGALTLGLAVSVAVAWAVPLITRRFRLFGYLVVGTLLVCSLLRGVLWFVGREAPHPLMREVTRRAGVDSSLTVYGLALVATTFVVLAPFVSRRWRRAGAVVLAALTVLRLLVPITFPATVAVALGLGAAVGSGTLLAFGRPSARPTQAAIAAALTGSGLPVAELEPASVDARGSVPYFATLEGGHRVFAKVLGSDQRAADLLFRAYRFIRLKNVGDERPFSSLRRTVEHEGLVALMARDVDARTPRLRAVATVGRDSVLLAYDLVDGRSLDRVPDGAVDEQVLRGIWEQVAVLHAHRIAHRDLRRANVLLDRDGSPWVIDFGFSEVAASQALLDADVAQLLVALALQVGAEPAVETAIATLGPEAVAASLPRLQPNTLGGATRDALKHRKGLLEEVRTAVSTRCGVPEPALETLDRIRPRTVLTVLTLVAVTYLLLPQLGDVPGMVDRTRDADWAWLPGIVATSALTYVGAALSMAGSVPDRLRPLPTLVTQLASSFASKLAPAGLGGMALNVRYLQKSGVDVAVAASGVGLNTVGGLVVHSCLLLVFAVWAGRSAFDAIRLPHPEVLLWGALAVVALAAVMFALPSVRRLVTQRLRPLLRRSIGGVAHAVRSPGKLLLLLGGSALLTLSYISCLYLCTRALGGHLGLAAVGAVYLLGAALAAAAPTPGGLGALEAAVIAGLVAAGMSHTIAVPAVFLYRLATFWLPVLPGWVAFTWLRRSDYV
jgi:undecaprenyl-diphosphatase